MKQHWFLNRTRRRSLFNSLLDLGLCRREAAREVLLPDDNALVDERMAAKVDCIQSQCDELDQTTEPDRRRTLTQSVMREGAIVEAFKQEVEARYFDQQAENFPKWLMASIRALLRSP
jgi:hypothetical protein